MSLLFVYGTLKKGFHNHYLLEDAPFICKAWLPFHKMLSLGGFPAIIPEGGYRDNIEGELYEVPEGRWPLLDRLEGVPHLYRREQIEIWNNPEAKWHEAQVYIWNQPTKDLPLVPDGIWR